jgi:copper transport protein
MTRLNLGRQPRRAVLAALAALALILALGAAPTMAHATLELVDPADGVSLTTAPGQVHMVFSEAVSPELAWVELMNASGAVVDGATVAADPANAAALIVTLPHVGSGAYRLAWQVIDQQDLHVTTGTVVFGVGAAAPAAAGQTAVATNPFEVLARWLDLGLLAAACGSLLFLASLRSLVTPRSSLAADGLRRRLGRLAVLTAAGGLVAHVALLILQVTGAAGVSPVSLLVSTFGVAWLAQGAILLTVLVAFAADRRGASRRVGPLVSLAVLGLAAGVVAVTGHVGTGDGAQTPWRWAALTVHLTAMLAWAGGLAALAVAVGPLLRTRGTDRDLARAVLGRFWRVAAPALAALAVTGLYLGGQLIASVDALLLTTYGRALLVKTAIAAIAILFGGANAAALHPHLRARLLAIAPFIARLIPSTAIMRRTLALEAVAAMGVVLAAAVMGSSAPALGPQFEPEPAAVAVVPAAALADDLMVTVAIRPDRPGPNFLDLAVLETRRPAPAPITSVRVRLVAPSGAVQTMTPSATAKGRYLVNDLTLGEAGAWRVEVAISRPGLADTVAALPWSVAPALAAPHAVLVSDASLAPVATPAALLAALLFGVLATVPAALRVLTGRRRHDADAPRAGIAQARAES